MTSRRIPPRAGGLHPQRPSPAQPRVPMPPGQLQNLLQRRGDHVPLFALGHAVDERLRELEVYRGAEPSEVARKTMPQPVLSAPRTTITGAPVVWREPATTSRVPAEYLCAGSAVRGISPLSESASVHTSEDSTRPRGDADVMAATSPACSRPGDTTHPTFTACAHTVKSARTAAPSTSPVAPSTPEGTSTASTGAEESLIPSMRRASLSPPEKPVPSRASMTRSVPSSSASSSSAPTSLPEVAHCPRFVPDLRRTRPS